MEAARSISIWFFIGICLLVDGVLILGAGIYQLIHPPLHPVVLYSLHANVWWGALLAVVGLLFFVTHAPWRHRTKQ
jgi:hypothetical protein